MKFDTGDLSLVSNLVFQKAPNKTPPDQVNLLGEIIKQMTIQMKNIEMITKMN